MSLPIFIVFAFLASIGPALWITALNVKYRDFRYIMPFIVQFGFFLSPVGFSTSRVPVVWHWHGWDLPARLIYSFNPMVGVIDGFRWCLLRGQSPLDPAILTTSVAVSLFLGVTGIWYFRKVERTFADVI